MATYYYQALETAGSERRGNLQAKNEREARAQLRGQGLRVVALSDQPPRDLPGLLRVIAAASTSWLPIRDRDRTMFYRQMELMLRAGHTLLEALTACARLCRRQRMRRELTDCAQRIQEGTSLSAALAKTQGVVDRLGVKLIEVGESSGELDAIFARLTQIVERRGEVRRQTINALVYPAIVVLMAIAVVSFLVISVIPRFAAFLTRRGKALPGAAQALLDISAWLSAWGLPVLIALSSLFVTLLFLRQWPPAKLWIDRAALHVPVIGGTIVLTVMAQLSWILAMLVKSRLTVLESLRVCAQLTHNRVFSHAFERAAARVLEGGSIAAALEQPGIPTLLTHMAAIGEKSGSLDTVMEELGRFYQSELDSRVKLLASMIEPVMTLLIGGVVGFVYFAFFRAVFSLGGG